MSEKSKNILLGVLIVGLVSMTVAYAALSTSLQINGTANVAATTWDIHFANVEVDKANTTGASENSNGVITTMGTLDNALDSTNRSIGTAFSGLVVDLAKPGDKATITFDIVNAGTIDAKNTVFTKHIAKTGGETTDTTNDVVTYTITCDNGADGNDHVLTKNGGSNNTAHCTLVVKYDDNAFNSETRAPGQQASQTAGQDQTVNQPEKEFTLDASWTYVQN